MIEKKKSDKSCDSTDIATALIIVAAGQRTQRESGGASVYTGIKKIKSIDPHAWTAGEVLN